MLNFMMLGKLLKPNMQTEQSDHNNEEHIDDLFMKAIEEKAAEYQVTVDYYMAEFM